MVCMVIVLRMLAGHAAEKEDLRVEVPFLAK